MTHPELTASLQILRSACAQVCAAMRSAGQDSQLIDVADEIQFQIDDLAQMVAERDAEAGSLRRTG